MFHALLIPALVTAISQTPAARPGALIPPDEGRAMIQAHQEADVAKRMAAFTANGFQVTGVAFSAEVIRSLLDKPGVVMVRWHFALRKDGIITLVGVGYDAAGMETNDYVDAGAPCPEFCR